jgi:hypothetical protein
LFRYIEKTHGCCGPPASYYFAGVDGKEKFRMKIETTERPSDYIWENLSTPYALKLFKVILSNISAVIFLIVGFAIIIQAKNTETKAKLKLGSTECSVFTFQYSGEPEWIFRYLNQSSVVKNRVDVQQNEYPDKYNVTYPNTGLLGCYCQYINTVAPDDMYDLEFLNPYSNE